MRKLTILLTFVVISCAAFAQVDAEQLALDVANTDAANTEQLKAFMWKRYSSATVNGEKKASLITEFYFDENGELQADAVGGETSVKQKPGVRGRIQENVMEDNMDYVGQALQLALAYTYMSKGQLLDFFEQATITEKDDVYEVSGSNVYVKGDSLTVIVEKAGKLFISKTFSSLLGEDAISGKISYAKFSSGINHGTTTKMNLPAKGAVIDAENKDYSQRVQ